MWQSRGRGLGLSSFKGGTVHHMLVQDLVEAKFAGKNNHSHHFARGSLINGIRITSQQIDMFVIGLYEQLALEIDC